MRRGHRGIQQLWELDAPVIVACKGWVMGGSFQRALLCDIRVAAEGTRFRLPEVTYGVIPDTGGVAVLYEMCGHGLVSDMVLTGRILSAEEALAHGIVSRDRPADELDATVREMAEQIAASPAVTVKMAREVIRHLAQPQIRASMTDEMIYQTFISRSDDMAEMRARTRRGPRAALHGELTDSWPRRSDCPRRRPSARPRCRAGTFADVVRVRHRRRHRVWARPSRRSSRASARRS